MNHIKWTLITNRKENLAYFSVNREDNGFMHEKVFYYANVCMYSILFKKSGENMDVNTYLKALKSCT